jgi:serine/threonine-protein kinase
LGSALTLTTLDGRYHVVDRIAAGGMGEVFRAHDAVLAREVAIKVLHPTLASDPGFIDRFRREARAAASLNHPNIVAVHDWGAVDGIYFMVMEYVRGESLRDILNVHGVLAPAQAADVLMQVLAALDHAHRQGIVHRDVKPENVMVTPDGIAKVADFGLARAYADSRATQAGRVTGTVQYLAPEQLQGEPADPRTDLYSLGIVAFELLTGRVPFTAETSMAIAYKHIRERVPRPSSRNPAIPGGLDGWVASMTEKERELRPESAAEARRDLQVEARDLPPATPIGALVAETLVAAPDVGPDRAPTVTIPGTDRKRRKRGRRILGALFVLLAIAAAAWGAWTYLIPHNVDVPQVIGLTTAEAQAKLEGADLVVKLGQGRYSKSDAGTVIQTQPDAGTSLRKGSTVTLYPSLGPPPVPVPDLTEMTIAAAKAALAKAHLSLDPEITREYSDSVATGRVMSQSVAALAEAPRGSAIAITVSKGPTPVPVPNVVGKTEVQAKDLLQAWVVKLDTRYSGTVPRGTVIDQKPPAKSELQPGSTVTIVVSLGPKTFPLPNVVGLTTEAARAKLETLGLTVQLLPVPGATGHTVVSMLPAANSTVHVGDRITLYYA